MRRNFNHILTIILTIGFCFLEQTIFAQTENPWAKMDEIRQQIKAPVFPDQSFLITDFGAVGDGSADCSKAIKRAIERCHKSGGGRVLVPEGDYCTGPIYLKSNVNLHLSRGARLLFSTNPKEYLPLVHTRWEGVELMNYSPLVYAFGETNIAVTGEGVLDGQASKANWWKWNGATRHGWSAGMPSQRDSLNRPALFRMGEENVPVSERQFGEGHYLRPMFFQPYQCEGVLLEGVTLKNSPMWIIHPVLCENVIIRQVTVDSAGPNTDGCDPESCRNVLIEDCTFNTGDDCIALKSGRNNDGRRINIPSENIIIRGCHMIDGHGGIVIGSEITGGAKNIFVEDCTMDSPGLKRAIRIKTNSARGGTIEDVYLRNLEVGTVSEALLKINLLYEDGDGHGHTPLVRNIWMENVHCKRTRYPLFLLGSESSKITGIHLKNVVVEDAKEASMIRYVKAMLMEDVSFQTSKQVDLWGTVQ